MSNALFHQDVVVATLASGSRGNCTYVGTERAGVLIDCGLSTRQVFRRLDEIGLPDTRIEAVLVTHEHCDHVGAARILDERLRRRQGQRVPFYMTQGTDMGLSERCRPAQVDRIRAGEPFAVGQWVIEPTSVPHDTLDPVSFLVRIGEVHVGVFTDLGRATRLVQRQLARLDIAVVEFNHDLEMLMDGGYPWHLKQRVRGAHGHLSNAQAADLVSTGASGRLKHLVLAHLSEENNTPERALDAAQQAVWGAGLSGVQVQVASQQLPLGPMRLTTPMHAASRGATPRRRRPTHRPVPTDDSARQISLF